MDAKFDNFMKDQVKKIKSTKAEADKKAGHDLGDGFIHDWIKNNSALFRKQWEKDHTMKIFCLGSNKTGTTSLAIAMKMLGFKPSLTEKSHALYLGGGLNHSKENIEKLFQTFKEREYDYDFFVDIPFSLSNSHKILYEMFPDAYFILTIRDSEKWFDSVIRWIQKYNAQETYNWIWSTEVTEENKEEVIKLYDKRNTDIIEFFKNKPLFLALYTEDKDNFKILSAFLNRDTVDKSFPHENQN